MKTRRLAVAGLSLIAVVAFAAGCGASTDNSRGSAATTAPADPKAALVQAAAKLGTTSFKMNVDMGTIGTMTGEMDPPSKAGKLTMVATAEGKMTINNLLSGTDLYMKMDIDGSALPGMDPDKWMHLDTTKLPATNWLGIRPGEFDPVSATKFIGAANEVKRTGDNTFTGTLDLSKTGGAMGITDKDITDAGAKGKAVPFEATTDAEGRLTKLIMDMPAMGGEDPIKVNTTYSDFGAPVSVTKPGADEVTEAPATTYEMFKE